MSPMGPRLMGSDSPASTPVHPDVVSWMASVVYLVGTPAVFLFGYIVDNYGRKKALMLTSVSMSVTWALKLYSTETWALITARAILGLGASGVYVVTPVYIKEISEDSIRGTLGSLVVLSQNLGNLAVYVIGEHLSYYTTLWICLAVPLVHLLVFTTMPDSPSYLLKTVSNKSACRALRITIVITLARELCGCITILHFASLIFSKASSGWVLTVNQQTVVLGVVQFIGSCTASSLVERTGRKPLLGITCLVSGISMCALGAWFYAQTTTSAGVSWLPIAALCLCIYCDAAGLQPVPFVIMTELFSFQLRGVVTSIVICLTCSLITVELRVFQPLAASMGLHTVFWLFSAVCIISTVYIALMVPETKMRTLDEIYAEIGGKKGKDVEADVTKI